VSRATDATRPEPRRRHSKKGASGLASTYAVLHDLLVILANFEASFDRRYHRNEVVRRESIDASNP
jgi:hypothetical protein